MRAIAPASLCATRGLGMSESVPRERHRLLRDRGPHAGCGRRQTAPGLLGGRRAGWRDRGRLMAEVGYAVPDTNVLLAIIKVPPRAAAALNPRRASAALTARGLD